MPNALHRVAPLCAVSARRTAAAAIVITMTVCGVASAQPPAPAERITFQDAVARAIARNPSSAVAAAGILRAEGLLLEARSATRLQV